MSLLPIKYNHLHVVWVLTTEANRTPQNLTQERHPEYATNEVQSSQHQPSLKGSLATIRIVTYTFHRCRT